MRAWVRACVSAWMRAEAESEAESEAEAESESEAESEAEKALLKRQSSDLQAEVRGFAQSSAGEGESGCVRRFGEKCVP